MPNGFFPGTFDPIHFGHINIASRAARLFDELIVGVYDRPLKNLLFNFEERLGYVQEALKDSANIRVIGYSGLTVDACRINNCQVIVRGLRVFSDFEYEFRMALANHRLAPDIEVVSLITNEDHTFLSSTTVREIASLNGDISSMVPVYVAKALRERYEQLNLTNPSPPPAQVRE